MSIASVYTQDPVDLPAPPFRQQYSAFGLPLTAQAWREQDLSDEGRLRAALHAELGEPDPARLRDPASFPEQARVLHRYIDALNDDSRAALLLELLPTEVDTTQIRRAAADTVVDLLAGRGINDFRASPEIGFVRGYYRQAAEVLRGTGRRPRALVLPYSNTTENVLASGARACDGAARIAGLLRYVSEGCFVVAAGFSQGATAVRVALERDRPRLDAALMLASMGGALGAGEHGVWAGRQGHTRTLAVVNEDDPARQIHGGRPLGVLLGALNFSDPQKRLLGGKSWFHGGYYGDEAYPLDGVTLHGVSLEGVPPERQEAARRRAAREAGTFAYPRDYVAAVVRRLLEGAFDGPFSRRGDWRFDLREELVEDGLEGRALDPTRLRSRPEDIARRYEG